jgi:hypothetical protein
MRRLFLVVVAAVVGHAVASYVALWVTLSRIEAVMASRPEAVIKNSLESKVWAPFHIFGIAADWSRAGHDTGGGVARVWGSYVIALAVVFCAIVLAPKLVVSGDDE